MTDEKVETPKRYVPANDRQMMELETNVYADLEGPFVSGEDYDLLRAELERVKVERDELREFHDACIKDMYQMLGIDGSDGELRYKWCALEISKLKQRATTAEAALTSVDMLLANRTALDSCDTREKKIRLAIKIAESNDQKGDLAKAEAALEKARENEGRYLWLTDKAGLSLGGIIGQAQIELDVWALQHTKEHELDAAIDAARTK